MQRNRVLIIILSIVIIITCFLILIQNKKEEGQLKEELVKEETSVEPVKELENVWIAEVKTDTIIIVEGNEQVTYLCKGVSTYVREQIADIKVQGENVIEITVKNHKINGKVLLNEEESISIEEYGTISVSENMKTYQIYGTVQEVSKGQIVIGYDYTDFVIEDDMIVAALLVRKQPMEEIRVLLKTSEFASEIHEAITLLPHAQYTMRSGNQEWTIQSGELIELQNNSEYFVEDMIEIIPSILTAKMQIPSIVRAQEMPLYRGSFAIQKQDAGLVIINVLPLEEYLYAVIPSEMPASYPMEALKAQAICARTYAYQSMEVAGKAQYGAHVDDSTGFQVYQNVAEQEATTMAVKETQGQLLYYENTLADTYYYSTSCGYGSDTRVWNDKEYDEKFYIQPLSISDSSVTMDEMIKMSTNMKEEQTFGEFITGIGSDDFENEYSFYRWTYELNQIDSSTILSKIKTRGMVVPTRFQIYELNSTNEIEISDLQELGAITSIEVGERLEGGNLNMLKLVTSNYEIHIYKEYNIRYVLGNESAVLTNVNESVIPTTSIVPSAFFIIELTYEGREVTGYRLIGGGYGHGVGMSQNGAKEMALVGWSCQEILQFFYHGTRIMLNEIIEECCNDTDLCFHTTINQREYSQ